MRKYIVTLLLLIFAVVCADAQINRNIMGVTIGKSTRQQVKTIITKKKYTIVENYDDIIIVKSYSGILFGGAKWGIIRFEFYKGKLYNLSFINKKDELCLSCLITKLDKKYSQFKTTKDVEGYWGDVCYYKDSRTMISIGTTYKGVSMLRYTDRFLLKLKNQAETDEL